jgi:hypothetical protein
VALSTSRVSRLSSPRHGRRVDRLGRPDAGRNHLSRNRCFKLLNMMDFPE